LDSEADLGLDSEEGPGLDAEEGPGLDAEAGLGLDSEEGPVLNAEAVSGLDAEAGPGLDSEAGLGLDSEEGPGSDMEAGPNSITSARISKLLKDGADAITIERLISAHGKLLIERLLKEMEECLAEIQADKQHPCQGSRWHELLQLFPSMFDHGEPLFAKIGTLNNPESLEYADVWLVTDDDACRRAQDGKPFPKPILICSDNNEMGSPLDDFLDRLMDRFGETTIDVQDLMVKNGGGPVRMDTPVVVERIKHPPPSLSNDAPPINCLNLRGGLVPTNKPRFLEGQRFDLIPTLHNRLDAGKRQTSTAGKQIDSIEIGRTNVDLHSCDSFGICATYGSWTGFHIDQHSGTYLTNYAGVKGWPIYTGPFSDDIKEEFAEQGPYWIPSDKNHIKVVLLLPGMTLCMMPNENPVPHAPVTFPTCVMSGGMFYDDLQLKNSLKNLTWAISNPAVTNEPVPWEFIAALHILQDLVLSNPRRYGFSGDGCEAEITGIFDRLRDALRCNCASHDICMSTMCSCLQSMARDHSCNELCVCGGEDVAARGKRRAKNAIRRRGTKRIKAGR